MEKPKGSLISFMANKVKSEGGINFAQGIPAFDPPKELLDCLSKNVYNPIHQYAPGVGNHKLLSLLEQHYNVLRANFLMVNGATEAISLLFIYLLKLITEKFAVLAFDPVYESYKHLSRIYNLPFIAQQLKADGSIGFNELELNIETNNVRLILLASPGNPLGKVWSKTEVEKLLEICNRNNTYIIFDAVYADLYFDAKPYFPIREMNDKVFYVNAFSKMLSITGWRVGYLIAHEKHMPDIRDVHDYTGLCVPSVLQQAVADYLEQFNYGTEYTKVLREKLRKNYKVISNELQKLGFEVFNAQGGYFVWASLPKGFESGLEFALKLYDKEKVAVVPGIHFSENGSKIIRVNIARNEDEIEKGIQAIARFVNDSKLA